MTWRFNHSRHLKNRSDLTEPLSSDGHFTFDSGFCFAAERVDWNIFGQFDQTRCGGWTRLCQFCFELLPGRRKRCGENPLVIAHLILDVKIQFNHFRQRLICVSLVQSSLSITFVFEVHEIWNLSVRCLERRQQPRKPTCQSVIKKDDNIGNQSFQVPTKKTTTKGWHRNVHRWPASGCCKFCGASHYDITVWLWNL